MSLQFNSFRYPEHASRQTSTFSQNGVPAVFVNGHFMSELKQGSKVEPGHEAKQTFSKADWTVSGTAINIYISDQPDVKFIYEEGVTKIGSIILPMMGSQVRKLVLGFGKTEIEATAVNKSTCTKVHMCITSALTTSRVPAISALSAITATQLISESQSSFPPSCTSSLPSLPPSSLSLSLLPLFSSLLPPQGSGAFNIKEEEERRALRVDFRLSLRGGEREGRRADR
eukprot:1750221-Rhodomonas_salina.1